MGNRLAQVAEERLRGLRKRQFLVEVHMVAEELLLVDRLPRSAAPHLRRSVGGDCNQGSAAFLGLDERREEVRSSGSARADEKDRLRSRFAIPRAKNAADRSSRTGIDSSSGWRASAKASGAERDPGETTARRSPKRTSVSTRTPAQSEFALRESSMVTESKCLLHGLKLHLGFGQLILGGEPATMPAPA